MSRMSTEIGRVLGGRYRIIAPIGMGASAQVFLADDARLRRRVAVKMLHDALAGDGDFLRRFQAEAQSVAQLSHPNVMAVFDWGEDDVPFLVTEYLGGGSLRALLDRQGTVTPSQVVAIGLKAARALDFAHRRGFVHRDIKPANLLFGDEGRLRIADFGLARALAEAAWTEPQGAVLGTARYASPEQAKGEHLTGRADVYSLGLVLIEAVTGQVPFTSDTTLGTLMARVDRPVPVPAAMGPLRPLLHRAGHPDPAERIDARTLAEGLLDIAQRLARPAPLTLAGALAATAPESHDPTLHGPAMQGDTHGGPAVVDLRDADLDVDPPAWVSSGEPTTDGATSLAAAAPGNTAGPPATGTLERRPRRRWPWVASAVALLAAAAVVAAYLLNAPAGHDVPDLKKASEISARRSVAGFKWHIRVVHGRADGSRRGEVIRTEPGAGSNLAEGHTLTLVVSDGNSLVKLPTDLVGSAQQRATAALQRRGLSSVLRPQHDETVPAGRVIGVAAGTPTRLAKGRSVALLVSDGPAPRVVPGDLVGATEADARAKLAAKQLVAGLVTVPSVAPSRTLDGAIAVLRRAGLSAGNVSGPATGRPRRTSPPAGQRIKRGRSVDIALG